MVRLRGWPCTLGAAGLVVLLWTPVAAAAASADGAVPDAGRANADGGVKPADIGDRDAAASTPPMKPATSMGNATIPVPLRSAQAERSAPAGRGSPDGSLVPHAQAVPPRMVTLSLASPSPVLGIDAETELRVVATGDVPSPLPFPRILCSTGRVEDLVREGPTSFSARFLLPSVVYPQVAIVVADFSNGSLILRGTLSARLRAATSPGFRTDPGARVTVRVGDKEFGPVVARADGNIHVPVVVPPGVDFALARSVNQYGKARQELIDLKIPRARRMLVVAPERLAAGSAGEVAVLAVDPSGRPADASSVLLASSGPRPEPLGARAPGEARFLVRAPATLQDPTLHLVATLRAQEDVTDEADLVLVPAPTSQITLQPEAIRPRPGPPHKLRMFLSACDVFGNPTDAGEATTVIDGRPVRLRSTDDGRAVLVVWPPAVLVRGQAIEVEAVLDNGHATERIPHSLFMSKLPPDPFLATRYTITPRLGLLSNLHHAPGSALIVEGMLSLRPSLVGLAFGASVGYLHSSFLAGNNAGAGNVEIHQMPVLALARYRHRVEQRLAVSVGAGAGMVLAWAQLRAFDNDVAGHSLAFAWECSTEAAYLLHRSQVVLGLHYIDMVLGKLSSGDTIIGNAGGIVLDAGYRIGWR